MNLKRSTTEPSLTYPCLLILRSNKAEKQKPAIDGRAYIFNNYEVVKTMGSELRLGT